MDQMSTINSNIDTLFNNLEQFTQKEGVIGKAVTHENKTFIPVVSVTMGYGGGNSAMKAGQTSTNQAGGAHGIGAKIHTEAVIVIDKENVSMLPLDKAGNTSSAQLIDKIPQMFMNMNQSKPGSQSSSQGQSSSSSESQSTLSSQANQDRQSR